MWPVPLANSSNLAKPASHYPVAVLHIWAKAKATENLDARHVGAKAYQLSDHLGNVTVTVSDLKRELPNTQLATYGITAPLGVDEKLFVAQVLSYTNYYAFGMAMPGRNKTSETYRYGFNGQEKSEEIAFGHTTALYWEYDSRVGRRWNSDPIEKPSESVYSCFGNNPILYVDPNGLDSTIYIYSKTTINDNGEKIDDISSKQMQQIKNSMDKLLKKNNIDKFLNVKIIDSDDITKYHQDSEGNFKNTTDAFVRIESDLYSSGGDGKTFVRGNGVIADSKVYISKTGNELNDSYLTGWAAMHEAWHQYLTKATYLINPTAYNEGNDIFQYHVLNPSNDGHFNAYPNINSNGMVNFNRGWYTGAYNLKNPKPVGIEQVDRRQLLFVKLYFLKYYGKLKY